MTRLVNVLSGYYDDIVIEIDSSTEIGNIISVAIERHSSNPDLLDQIKWEAREELLSRGYNEEESRPWIDAIDL